MEAVPTRGQRRIVQAAAIFTWGMSLVFAWLIQSGEDTGVSGVTTVGGVALVLVPGAIAWAPLFARGRVFRWLAGAIGTVFTLVGIVYLIFSVGLVPLVAGLALLGAATAPGDYGASEIFAFRALAFAIALAALLFAFSLAFLQ